jgi:predicted TIM-barrel fold metal-dependent hydrolase
VAARFLVNDRVGTAIGLRALNEEWGSEFYEVPEVAAQDRHSAEELFSGPEVVVDVQTHFLAPGQEQLSAHLRRMYEAVMPDWWQDLDADLDHHIAEYILNVFLRTETAVAVLTSGAGMESAAGRAPGTLYNDEMAAVRQLVDNLAGSGRLLNHAVVRANLAADLEAMEQVRDEFDPVGWKVYTHSHSSDTGQHGGWRLDDEHCGLPFLERARRLGVKLVCAHKGLAGILDNGSPDDVGPAARAFPDLDFVIYHSGFEFPASVGGVDPSQGGNASGEEGPYTDQLAAFGVNRLLRSLEQAGLGADCNVSAELGTTWFSLVRRPREAAHVLGKLIAYLGEDQVIWGTDSIWYGAAQPLIDALRVFQIPDDMCEQFGYAKLTPQVKAKILGGNAARIYGIDLAKAAATAKNDDLAWARQLTSTLDKEGLSGLRN